MPFPQSTGQATFYRGMTLVHREPFHHPPASISGFIVSWCRRSSSPSEDRPETRRRLQSRFETLLSLSQTCSAFDQTCLVSRQHLPCEIISTASWGGCFPVCLWPDPEDCG